MRHKTYKNRGYKEIVSSETPYLNIFTGQRIFIDPDVVEPKALFYVEDLNPYQRTISIVMDTRQRRIIRREKEKRASNLCSLIGSCFDHIKLQSNFGYPGFEYPMWFEALVDIMYYDVFAYSPRV